MSFKFKLVLFSLAVLVCAPSAADTVIRFGGRSCLQRVCQFGLHPFRAIRENRVTAYLDGAMSLHDLGTRFGTLSRGWYRRSYPDLPVVAAFIKEFESARLGGAYAYIVGIRGAIMQLVQRPFASYEVRHYTENEQAIAVSDDMIEYTIRHTDGSISQLFTYREGPPKTTSDRDRRPVVNVIGYSNGPQQPKSFVLHRENPGLGAPISTVPTDAQEFLNFIESQKLSGRWLEREAAAVAVEQNVE